MAPGPGLRVGDAERDATAQRLREHYAQGRLTLGEFNERLSAALAAKTERDLSELTRDLPLLPGPSSQLQRAAPGGWQDSGHARGRQSGRPPFLPVFVLVALAFLMVFAWLPALRLFPFPGKLAIFLVVVGLVRSLLRRLWRRRRF
jgi:hypothetical protein